MWYCESGCMEQRPGELVFDLDDRDFRYWRQVQGNPTKYVSGFHVTACSACQNLFEVWLKAQSIWFSFQKLRITGARIQAELEAAKRPVAEVESEMAAHELEVNAWEVNAFPVIQKWWEARKAEVGAEIDKRKAEYKAAKDKRDAEKAPKK